MQRIKLRQVTLTPIKRDTSNTEFNRQKRELRSWYKKWKVGFVKWDDIPKDQQELLIRYYGVLDD